MTIQGKLLIGAKAVLGEDKAIFAMNPADGSQLEPGFRGASPGQIEQACRLAAKAFDGYRESTLAERAAFLSAIADNIMAIGDKLIERAAVETGLPAARLIGERARTVGQLRLFAQVVLSGNWLEARLDAALPERQPLPRSDLRQRHVALGPVAVFGASNFPLAFSVAGGDTASALAAGCPVIVKAHSAHLGTSELVGQAVQAAVAQCGLPEGVFSMILGAGAVVGQALVNNPNIKAVGFTGSRGGGLALMAAAAARPEPIPIYAEMSSINPVLILPTALASRPVEIAKAFVGSLTMGAGQFCTNPGLIFAIDGEGFEAFAEAAGANVKAAAPATMLTAGIHKAYTDGVRRLAQHAEVLADGQPGGLNQAQAKLFGVEARALQDSVELQDEVFGPSSVLLKCKSVQEMHEVLESLEGQLTITLQMDSGDTEDARGLLPVLERKAGRILVNGFPTGVEVSHAMVHGGPYPSTSDGRSTSVGTLAIRRFLRPVCYQDFPAALLPAALENENPLGIWRLVDGELGKN